MQFSFVMFLLSTLKLGLLTPITVGPVGTVVAHLSHSLVGEHPWFYEYSAFVSDCMIKIKRLYYMKGSTKMKRQTKRDKQNKMP